MQQRSEVMIRTGKRQESSRWPALAWTLALCTFFCAGCPNKKQPAGRSGSTRLGIHEVLLVGLSWATPWRSKAEHDALQERAWSKVAVANDLVERAAQRGPGTYQLQVKMGIIADPEDPRPGKEVLAGMAQAEIPGKIGGFVLQASAATPLPSKGAEEQLRTLAEAVMDSLMEEVIIQAGLVKGPEEGLAQALAGKDLQRLAAAVDIAAIRGSAKTFEPLVKLLKHKDPKIADRAIGALTALGDRRAVYYLTRLTRLSDTAKMAKMLDAVGSLGGAEARQYLQFVATGHEDEDIRNMATEALERMSRKSRAAGSKAQKK